MPYSLMQRVFTVETFIRKKSFAKWQRKFRLHFPDVTVPSKSSMLERCRKSFPMLTLRCIRLCYAYYVQECKAI
jgi:hypothetical protein